MPTPVPAAETIPLADAEKLWRTGAGFFLDARRGEDYANGHIAQALNLSAEAFEQQFPAIEPMLTPDSALVVYCDGEQCDLSHDVLRRLQTRGYTRARVLVNGWTVWRRAGLPTTTGNQP